MKVLFIGGTGVISSACAALCVERGFDLWLLNRGKSFRPPPGGAKLIKADIRKTAEVRSALARLDFDVVVDWVAYDVGHVKNDVELFKDKAAQFVFISSATVYQKPPERLPITESTVLHNPYWNYARGLEADHREWAFSECRSGKRAWRMCRQRDWKYVYSADGRDLLFHIEKDPLETRNLADLPESSHRISHMRSLLIRSLSSIAAPVTDGGTGTYRAAGGSRADL